jgi:dihydroorotate dehydrogenase electron transfer subunit
MIQNENMLMVSQRKIAHYIYEMVLEGHLVELASPGQFIHIRVHDGFDPLLRRPISIAKIDKGQKRMTIIYRAEGKGTRLLACKQAGDTVDVIGPLGNGFPLHELKKGQKALIVGGGIGVPPLYELSRQLAKQEIEVIHVLGFQTKDVVFYHDQFAQLGETTIATVDGTYGYQGFVTDVIEQEGYEFDCLYACGPISMLKALEERFGDRKGYISLEERMGCGIGACFACVCPTSSDYSNDYRKICSDGPVFPFGEVIL